MIWLVRIYIYVCVCVCVQKNCNLAHQESNLPQVVVLDFFLAPVLAETLVTQHSPCYSAVSASLTNPLPGCSNYSPLCHTHYFILRIINTSLVSSWARPFAKPLHWRLILHCCSALLQNLVGNSGVTRSLEEAEQQAEESVDVPPPPLQIVISVPFCLLSFFSLPSLCSLSQPSLFSLSSFPLTSPPSLLSLLINSLSS